MHRELDNRLQKLIGEHKINLISPKGLLEISIDTIGVVRAHLDETDSLHGHDKDVLDEARAILLEHH